MTTSSTGSTSSTSSALNYGANVASGVTEALASSDTNSALIQSQGIGSGIDITSIISKLMSVESIPLTNLQTQVGQIQQKEAALTTVQTAVSSFEAAASAMSSASLYSGLTSSVANSSLATVSTSTGATAGSFSLEVDQLAAAQQLESGGFASANSVVGSGTLTIAFGTTSGSTTNGQYSGSTFTPNSGKSSVSISLNSSNNTLTGVMNAINASNSGVTASILYDGSQYHLVMSSPTGANSSMQITAKDSNGAALTSNTSGTLGQLAFDPTQAVGSGQNMLQNTAAASAAIKISGVPVTSQTNTVSNAMQGVTINLLQASSGNPTTVTMAQNQSAITTAANSFVTAYNALQTAISSVSYYNSSSNPPAGPLNGDYTIQEIQSQVSSVLNSISGTGSYTSIADLGFTLNTDGTMSFSASTLTNALNTDPASVASVLTQAGSASSSQLQFVSATNSIPSGNYAVNVTQLGSEGTATGTAIPSSTFDQGANGALSSITIPSGGISFQAEVNGNASGTITIPGGTQYADGNALAADLEARINADATLQANAATVSVTYNSTTQQLQFNSNQYGSDSSVYFPSPNGQFDSFANMFGLTNPARVQGKDVQGSIDGITATGAGQVLTGTGNLAGFQVQAIGPSTGAVGSINYSQGTMNNLNLTLQNMLNSTGIFANATNALNAQITSIQNQEADWQVRLQGIQANYEAEYNAMDSTVASLQSTSSQLTSELASVTANTKSA